MTTTLLKYWGKFFGGLANLYYLIFFYILSTLIISDIYFFGKIVFPETPAYVFVIFFLVPAFYAVKLGLETFARFTTFIVPLLVLLYSFTYLLAIPILDLDNIVPVMAEGIGPVLEGSIPNMNFPFAQLLPIVFLYKYTKNTTSNNSKFLSYTFFGVLLISFFLLIGTILSVTAFEIYTLQNITYPPYSVVRLIEVGDVLERIDAIYIATFYATTFLKFTVTYYVICQVIVDFFKIGATKDISMPVGVLLGVSVPLLTPRFDVILDSVVPMFYVFLPILTVIPLLLFFTIKIKSRKNKDNTKK